MVELFWNIKQGEEMIRNSKKLKPQTLEEVSKLLGENFKNSDITKCFRKLGLSDRGSDSTKWKRLLFVFNKYQNKNKNSKDTFRILEYLFTPVSYLNEQQKFKDVTLSLNRILCLEGIQINVEGVVCVTEKITDLALINERYNSLMNKLKERHVHSEVIKYCTQELLQENYFHSIFECCKGILERVRELSGLTIDGSKLLDAVFSTKNPLLKINELKNSSEINQQNGFKEMLNGITHYVRNVTAHTPKIKWIIDENEALEIFNIISFLHKILDNAERVENE